MKGQIDRHSVRVLLAVTVFTVGALAALGPTVEAAEIRPPTLYSQATKTNTDPDKKVFVRCPQGMIASGGGAQAFVRDLDKSRSDHKIRDQKDHDQKGRISITQVIPSQDLSGYAARAQAQEGFHEPWHLTAYAICHQ